MKTIASCFFACLLLTGIWGHTSLQAQEGLHGKPLGMHLPTAPPPVLSVDFPVSIPDLLKKDSLRLARGSKQYRYGLDSLLRLNFWNHAQRVAETHRGTLYQLKLHCPQAKSWALRFKALDLPRGSHLQVYNQQGYPQTFTARTAKHVATAPFEGSSVLLEYFQPHNQRQKAGIEIDRLTLGYRPLPSTQGFGSSGACNIDINCPDGLPYQDEKKAVCLILDGGWLCTGALVNTTSFDQQPLVYTANHCHSSSVNSWVFIFDYESPSCQGPNGSLQKTISGCDVRVRYGPSDAMLLELHQTVPKTYEPFFLGWDRSGTTPAQSISIHHPQGDVKKISFEDQPANKSAYGGNPGTSHWSVVWDRNSTTESGSSGAPLLNAQGQLIGTLEGGGASCATPKQADYFGRFSQGWSGGNPGQRLSDWLDPNNTGQQSIPGLNPKDSCLNPQKGGLREDFQSSLSLPLDWQIDNPDLGHTWQVIRLPHGQQVLRMNNYAYAAGLGQKDALRLPSQNWAGADSVTLSFDLAYQVYDSLWSDSLQVLLSRDCGKTLDTLFHQGGQDLATFSGKAQAAFVPQAGDWQNQELRIPAAYLADSSVLIQLVNHSGYGQNLYVDNLQVQVFTKQAFLRWAAGKVNYCQDSVLALPYFSNFPDSIQWLTAGLDSLRDTGDTLFLDSDTTGTFVIQAVLGQDTLRKTISLLPRKNAYDSSFALRLDSLSEPAFQASQLRNPQGDELLWEVDSVRGNPAGALFIDNYQYQQVGSQDFIDLPPLDLQDYYKPRLFFDHAYRPFSSTNTDSLYIALSTSCGLGYELLWQKGGFALAGDSQTANTPYYPANQDWQSDTIDLNSYTDQLVSIRLANISGYGNRLYVDNIRVESDSSCLNRIPFKQLSLPFCAGDSLRVKLDSVPQTQYQLIQGGSQYTILSDSLYTLMLDTGSFRIEAQRNGCPLLDSTFQLPYGIDSIKLSWDSARLPKCWKEDIQLHWTAQPAQGLSYEIKGQGFQYQTRTSAIQLQRSELIQPIQIIAQAAGSCLAQTRDTLHLELEKLLTDSLRLSYQFGKLHTSPGYAQYYWYTHGKLLDSTTQNEYPIKDTGKYWVVAQDSTGCLFQSRIQLYLADLLSEHKLAVHLYPQPAHSSLFIEWNAKEKLQAFRLMNSLGHTLIERKGGEGMLYRLDVSGLPPGTYIWQGQTLERCISHKVLIIH